MQAIFIDRYTTSWEFLAGLFYVGRLTVFLLLAFQRSGVPTLLIPVPPAHRSHRPRKAEAQMPLETFFAAQRRNVESLEEHLFDQPFWIG